MDLPHPAIVLGLALAAGSLVAGCAPAPGPAPDVVDRLSFDFRTGSLGWSAGFADVAVAQAADVAFVADHRALPPPLQGGGLQQSGLNLSDDLCMWFAGSAAGFEPGADYAISFDVGIASSAGSGCDIGIAASTAVKAGVAAYQPDRVDVAGYWLMNVDKGLPTGDGAQALALGDIRNSLPGCTPGGSWGERSLHSGQREVRVRAPEDGVLWFFVLTDSAWEGWYEVYFTYLEVRVRRVSP
ncbi:MAG TPA: hypothetical protein VLD85_07250 [Anaeromyxobacteraceae bacterium]|nr:hypothetical protein [Anaeromyxobacteraceae bacterium]